MASGQKRAAAPFEIVAKTPRTANCFFGFYDICPWSPAGDDLLALRHVYDLDRLPDGAEVAEVCVWNPERETLTPVGATRAWNLQQAARMRWLADGSVLYNDLEGAEPCARIATACGRLLRTIPQGVWALRHDGAGAASPSFGRLGRHYPGYGYGGARAASADHPCPADDGLWLIDMASGRSRLMVSLADLAEDAGLGVETLQFVSHPAFSPSDSRLFFCHTYKARSGRMFTRLMLAAADGSGLRCVVSGKISHPCWRGDDQIVLWARPDDAGPSEHTDVIRAVGKLLRNEAIRQPARSLVRRVRRWMRPLTDPQSLECGYVLDLTRPGSPTPLPSGLICEDGHLSVHPVSGLLLADAYPDEHNLAGLYLCDLDRRRRVDMGAILHDVRHQDPQLRCDLHPRWNQAGDKVAVDVCEDGLRRLAILDVGAALGTLRP